MRLVTSAAVIAIGLFLAGCGSSSASSIPSSSSAGGSVTRFPGNGMSVTPKNVETVLSATSPTFRAFITQHLRELWSKAGSVKGCEESALIVLASYHSDGWANASNEGMFGNDKCAAGGNSALYAQTDGTWKEIIGTQSGYSCSELTQHKVPTGIVDSCLDSSGKPQPYQG